MFRLIVLLLLSSCGYQSLKPDMVNSYLSSIEFEYDLKNKKLSQKQVYYEILENFKETKDSKYILEITSINESETPLDLDRDGEAREYNYNLSVGFKLSDLNNKILDSGILNSSLNFTIESFYASQIAIDKNRIALSRQIASDLKDRLESRALLN